MSKGVNAPRLSPAHWQGTGESVTPIQYANNVERDAPTRSQAGGTIQHGRTTAPPCGEGVGAGAQTFDVAKTRNSLFILGKRGSACQRDLGNQLLFSLQFALFTPS